MPVPTGTTVGPKVEKEVMVQGFFPVVSSYLGTFYFASLVGERNADSEVPVPTGTNASSYVGKEIKVWL